MIKKVFLMLCSITAGILAQSLAQEPNDLETNGASTGTLQSASLVPATQRIFFGKKYDFVSSETLTIDGTDILQIRYGRDNVPEFTGESAVVLVLQGKGKTQTLEIPTSYGGEVKRLNVPEPILAVSAPLGGNGWKMSPHHILSLHPAHFLEKIGQVDWVIENELSDVDATFESTPWNSHVGAPQAQTYYKVENGKLILDKEKNQDLWERTIEQMNKEIGLLNEPLKRDVPAKDLMNNPYLTSILTRLLHYRLLGRMEEGWKKTEQDLTQHFGKNTADEVLDEIRKRMPHNKPIGRSENNLSRYIFRAAMEIGAK